MKGAQASAILVHWKKKGVAHRDSTTHTNTSEQKEKSSPQNEKKKELKSKMNK